MNLRLLAVLPGLRATPLAALLLLGACARVNQYDDLRLAPLPGAEPRAMSDRPVHAGTHPRLGIAFGGGGVRGFVHVGVLRALDEAGIRADVTSGTSVGAIAAALYASGLSQDGIEARVRAIDEIDLLDPVFSREGFVHGQALAAWIRDIAGGRAIQELPMPLAVAVTDLGQGEARWIVEGDLGEAVQASASVPGTVVPVRAGRATLIDGGALVVLPVRAARQLGAEVVIGIDIYCGQAPALKGNALDTLLRTLRLQSCALSEAEMREADILIQPTFEPGSPMRFSDREKAIDAGYQAARAALPEIRAKLGMAPVKFGNAMNPTR